MEQETGIPGELTDKLIHALKGADHLGSLLKIDAAVDAALDGYEMQLGRAVPAQLHLWEPQPETPARVLIAREAARTTILERMEQFLSHHTHAEDLGLRLRGEQLAAGVRFVRLLREATYDLVVGNPPYQGTSRMRDSTYINSSFPNGKADLFAVFLERGLRFAKRGGISAMLTMRSWMFVFQYSKLRQFLLREYDLRILGDFAIGAFDEVHNDLLSVVASVFRNDSPASCGSVAIRPTPPTDRSYDRERTRRKRSATLAQAQTFRFHIDSMHAVPDQPLTYWWDECDYRDYRRNGAIKSSHRVAQGISTANDSRFIRYVWESLLPDRKIILAHRSCELRLRSRTLAPLIKGAMLHHWIEPLTFVVSWHRNALGIRTNKGSAFRSPHTHFTIGIACTAIGSDFRARVHRYSSVCHNSGTSIFDIQSPGLVCGLMSHRMSFFLSSLNPGMHFEVGDISRAPQISIAGASEIWAIIESAFTLHESHREPSVEFKHPGPSPWQHVQEWAQLAVDRAEGDPLPPYEQQLNPEPATDHLSFAPGCDAGTI